MGTTLKEPEQRQCMQLWVCNFSKEVYIFLGGFKLPIKAMLVEERQKSAMYDFASNNAAFLKDAPWKILEDAIRNMDILKINIADDVYLSLFDYQSHFTMLKYIKSSWFP